MHTWVRRCSLCAYWEASTATALQCFAPLDYAHVPRMICSIIHCVLTSWSMYSFGRLSEIKRQLKSMPAQENRSEAQTKEVKRLMEERKGLKAQQREKANADSIVKVKCGKCETMLTFQGDREKVNASRSAQLIPIQCKLMTTVACVTTPSSSIGTTFATSAHVSNAMDNTSAHHYI